MLEYGDIVGKNVLLLGDDDFLSVVLASLRSAARIVVIDVDARVIERIGQIATREKLDITIVHHDYRNALPHDLTSIFDTVFVDPPYTPSALQVAVNRAIDALRPEGDKRCYICYSSMDLSSKAILGFQSYLCARHLVWIGLHQSFNRYSARPDMDDEAVRCGYQPTRNWFASSLACLSTTEGTAQTAARLPEDPIYCYE
jgi:predicted methyltransferase